MICITYTVYDIQVNVNVKIAGPSIHVPISLSEQIEESDASAHDTVRQEHFLLWNSRTFQEISSSQSFYLSSLPDIMVCLSPDVPHSSVAL